MSIISGYFAATYAEARQKFIDGVGACGMKLESHECPAKGPDGAAIFMDVARFGADDAAKVLVVQSGTHGVEGFCGSGVQVGLLQEGSVLKTKGVAVLMLHAANPHGFAHLSRTTEENVDLNRNWADFSKPLPENEGYEALKDAICPKDWSPEGIAEADKNLNAFIQKKGFPAFQAAASIGQYRHPDGIFFGGKGPTWARRTLEDVVRRHCLKAKHVAHIDFHTGLGPYSYGEPIATSPPSDPGYERCRAWYGPSVTSPEGGDSTSAVVRNHFGDGFRMMLGKITFTGVALEYGTLPTRKVLDSLRADNWLRFHGKADSLLGKRIKQDVRDAFYGDTDDWKEMVWFRGRQVFRAALRGLQDG